MKGLKNREAEINEMENPTSITGGGSGCFSQGGIWDCSESG